MCMLVLFFFFFSTKSEISHAKINSVDKTENFSKQNLLLKRLKMVIIFFIISSQLFFFVVISIERAFFWKLVE